MSVFEFAELLDSVFVSYTHKKNYNETLYSMMKLLNVPVIQKRSTKMDRQPACIPPSPSTCSTTVAAEEEHQISFERLLVHHHTRDAPGLTTASNENTRTNNSLVDDDETNSSTVLDQVLVVGESYYLLNELVEVLSPKPREDERATDAGAKSKYFPCFPAACQVE